RTLGCRSYQILEFPESVRLNCVAFIGSEVVAVLALVRENVEVVKPEIVHHLLELPLTVNRTRNLGHAQLSHHALRSLAVVGNRARNIVGIAASQSIPPAHAFRGRIPFGLLLLHGRGSVAHVRLRVRSSLLCRLRVASALGLSLRFLRIPRNGFRSCITSALFLPRLCLSPFLGLLL